MPLAGEAPLWTAPAGEAVVYLPGLFENRGPKDMLYQVFVTGLSQRSDELGGPAVAANVNCFVITSASSLPFSLAPVAVVERRAVLSEARVLVGPSAVPGVRGRWLSGGALVLAAAPNEGRGGLGAKSVGGTSAAASAATAAHAGAKLLVGYLVGGPAGRRGLWRVTFDAPCLAPFDPFVLASAVGNGSRQCGRASPMPTQPSALDRARKRLGGASAPAQPSALDRARERLGGRSP